MAEFAANSETSQTYSVDISCFNEQRIRDFAEIFQAVDSDNDGAISVRELKDMFATLGYQISRKVLRRFIRMVDVDRNGTLSFNEFVSLLVLVNNALAEGEDRPDIYEADFSNFTPDEIEHFRAIFQAVDANGDGTVSVEELYDMFLALNYCNVTEEIIQNLVRSVDSDLSGNLCFEEFVALIILVHQEQNNQNTEPVTSADTTFQIDTSKFSNKEMQRFFSIFRSVDSNNDGTVDIGELNQMFATLNYEVTEEMLRQMIAAVDTDQSGNLSFREFIALVILVSNSLNTDEPEEKSTVEFTSEDHARFTELFRSVDTDGSGSISTSELGNLFDNLGYETSEELMQQFIAMVDTDNDGVLNYNEFVQLIIYYLESLKQAS